MLLIFNDIKYGDHLILHSGEISLNKGKITLITGESGSGKTSLLKWLVEHSSSVFLNSESRISVCVQDSDCIEDLSAEENIALIRDFCDENEDIEEYLEALQLKDLLNRYPAQLSGGEQKRLSFILSFMLEADVYIFDEPNASVNHEFTDVYISLLNKLKEKGKYVLLFTHDYELMKCADMKYAIVDRNLCEQNTIQNIPDTEIQKSKRNGKQLPKYIRHAEHRGLLSIILAMVMTVCIASAGIMYGRNSAVYQAQQNILSGMVSNEIVVFKENTSTKDSSGNTFYNYDLQEPFTEEEVQSLSSISHVTDVQWRYDISESSIINDDITQETLDWNNISTSSALSVYKENSDIGQVELNGLYTCSYLPAHKQESDIEKDFGTEGIYLSRYTANDIEKNLQTDDAGLEGLSLQYSISVPLYNTYGRYQMARDDGELAYTYSTTVTHQTVNLPIAGILKDSSFGLQNNNTYSIYIERETIEELINANKPAEDRKLYVIDDQYHEYYLNEVPSSYTGNFNRVFEDTVWRPSAYSIYVDGVENIDAVMNEIEKLGFVSTSQYADHSSLMSGIFQVKNMYLYSTVLLSLIAVIGSVGIAFMKKKKRRKQDAYLYKLGADHQMIVSSRSKAYLLDTLTSVGVILCINIIYCIVMSVQSSSLVLPSFLSIIISISLCAVCVWLIPYLFERKAYAENQRS